MPLPAHRSGPRNPLSHERILRVCYAYRTLWEHYTALGGEITSALYATTLEIEKEIISWEQRSAKLRYEARRQAQYRATRPTGEPLTAPLATFDDPDANPIPAATRQAIERFKAEGASPTATTGPDTSNYRKSGLV